VDGTALRFGSRLNKERDNQSLDTLASLDKAWELADGRFVAV
jgi:hypothetical protein